MRTALPRVQQATTLRRVPTDARGRLHEPPATTTPTNHTVRTNAPPAMTTQPIPSKPRAPRSSKNHQPCTTGGTRMRSMIARDTAHAALPASRTHSKTEAANGTQQRFEQMENEVHQALAVMDKETGRLLNYRQLLRSPKHGVRRQPTSLAALLKELEDESKAPTQSSSSTNMKSQPIACKMSHTGNLYVQNAPRRQKLIAHGSL
jgi:hypothetical protein